MKTKSQFVCQQCGYSQSQWAGKCPNCESWNSMVETTFTETRNSKHEIRNKSQIINLKDIKTKEIGKDSRTYFFSFSFLKGDFKNFN